MKNICDCIIPFYNEGSRAVHVVGSVLKVKNLSKIIVVDDGSADRRTNRHDHFTPVERYHITCMDEARHSDKRSKNFEKTGFRKRVCQLPNLIWQTLFFCRDEAPKN